MFVKAPHTKAVYLWLISSVNLILQELFLKLVPYHCLGSLWSQRDKKGHEGVCWSVRATVRQFNRLANAVTASCLWQTELKTQQRTRLLEKWISVAEVRALHEHFNPRLFVLCLAMDLSIRAMCSDYTPV